MNRRISTFLKYGTLISSLGLIGTVLLQIFARFLLDSAPSWTEEASRFCFVYAMAFAAGLALKSNYYVALDIIAQRVSDRTLRRLDVISTLGVLMLFALITIYAIPMIIRAHAETSPSMQFNMSYVFFSIALMGVSMSYFSMIRLMSLLNKKR